MEMLLNAGLRKYLDQLKVSDTETAKKDILPVVDEIRKIIAGKDPRFESGLVFKGSIYEKAKIKSADEFDFELPIPSLRITDAPHCKLPVTSSGKHFFRPRLGREDCTLQGGRITIHSLISCYRVF